VGLEVFGGEELHRVGGHHRQLQLGRQGHRGTHQGLVVRQAAALQLDVEAAGEQGGQRLGGLPGPARVARQQGLAHRAELGAREHDQALTQLLQPIPTQQGLVALYVAGPGAGQQFREVVVAGDVLHQQQQAPRRRVRRAVHRFDPGVAAHHRLEALAAAGLVVLDRAEQVAQVGNAQGQLPVVLGCGHRIVDPQGAIDDGVFGVQAQVNKTHRGIVRSGVRVLDLGGAVSRWRHGGCQDWWPPRRIHRRHTEKTEESPCLSVPWASSPWPVPPHWSPAMPPSP